MGFQVTQKLIMSQLKLNLTRFTGNDKQYVQSVPEIRLQTPERDSLHQIKKKNKKTFLSRNSEV